MPKRSPKPTETGSTGRFAYERLERSMHEKARLGIMTSLLTHPEGVSFNDLKQLCNLTDGNLSRHLEVLQQDGLIAQEKLSGSGRSTTVCGLTPLGRQRFLEYLDELQRVISDAAAGAKATTPVAKLRWSAGG